MTTRRLLFVHAHPDDEASKGAATAARYVDAGDEVVLVTCTGGEAGEVLNDKHPPVAPDDLAAVREKELADAVRIIGFRRSELLGFPDSGFPDDPTDVDPSSFAGRDLDEVSRPLAALLRRERPHVVVTYPPDGGYPHPDHIRVHDATMRAVELAADPDADGVEGTAWDVPRTVFMAHFSIARMEAMGAVYAGRGLDNPMADWLERSRTAPARDADRAPECRIDVTDWLDRRDDALRAHVTQVDPDGQWFAVPRDIEVEAFPWDTYVVLAGTPFPDGATDLFDGLGVTADDQFGRAAVDR